MSGKGAGWKATERRIARDLGVTRNGPTGLATADVTTDRLSVEVKHTRRAPQRAEAALRQAERAAGPGKLAIAVIHPVGGRGANDLVVMRWGAFLDWFGDDPMANASDEERAILTPDKRGDA